MVVGENFTCTETEVQSLKSQIELAELVTRSMYNLRVVCVNRRCGGDLAKWKRDFPCATIRFLQQENLSLPELNDLSC